jgi:hypothetical protein
MSITVNGATNTITAAAGLAIAGNTAVTGTLSATGDISITKTGTSPYLVTTRTGESTCYIGSQATENVLISRDSATGDRRLLITVGTTTRGMFDSNGLAVTGTLSASGATTLSQSFTAFGVSLTGTTLDFTGADGTTKYAGIRFKGWQSYNSYFGRIPGSDAVAYGTDSTGSYASVVTFSSTGLAVTGTLSASGITSVTDTTDATSTTAASLKTAGGLGVAKKLYVGDNIVMASGQGIDFSATANGSGTVTSEVLSDYEEGTWTPTLIGETTAGTQTYGTRAGIYTKVGNVVTVSGTVTITAKDGAMAGNVVVGGLPFTVNNATLSVTVGPVAGQTGITYPSAQTQISCLAVGNTTYMRLIVDKSNGGGGAYITVTDIASTTAFGFTCTYRV